MKTLEGRRNEIEQKLEAATPAPRLEPRIGQRHPSPRHPSARHPWQAAFT
jgi:hypothetical protein